MAWILDDGPRFGAALSLHRSHAVSSIIARYSFAQINYCSGCHGRLAKIDSEEEEEATQAAAISFGYLLFWE